ncbi:YhbY family RNA-binding protein [Halovenus rubra]|uniref:YhbY family RNA-binding protein n=2 Tax=Halovenus rubra TaxID=869890 RepID=A0ABD5X861_9EURY|nr:YhbY family RNA-binding protein [Halovenus rubra]
MSSDELREKMHSLDATLRVGKNGIESVAEELETQLDDRRFVKVKFHRASRAGTDTEELAQKLADRVGASGIETRGHTAVIAR